MAGRSPSSKSQKCKRLSHSSLIWLVPPLLHAEPPFLSVTLLQEVPPLFTGCSSAAHLLFRPICFITLFFVFSFCHWDMVRPHHVLLSAGWELQGLKKQSREAAEQGASADLKQSRAWGATGGEGSAATSVRSQQLCVLGLCRAGLGFPGRAGMAAACNEPFATFRTFFCCAFGLESAVG